MPLLGTPSTLRPVDYAQSMPDAAFDAFTRSAMEVVALDPLRGHNALSLYNSLETRVSYGCSRSFLGLFAFSCSKWCDDRTPIRGSHSLVPDKPTTPCPHPSPGLQYEWNQ